MFSPSESCSLVKFLEASTCTRMPLFVVTLCLLPDMTLSYNYDYTTTSSLLLYYCSRLLLEYYSTCSRTSRLLSYLWVRTGTYRHVQFNNYSSWGLVIFFVFSTVLRSRLDWFDSDSIEQQFRRKGTLKVLKQFKISHRVAHLRLHELDRRTPVLV